MGSILLGFQGNFSKLPNQTMILLAEDGHWKEGHVKVLAPSRKCPCSSNLEVAGLVLSSRTAT